MKKIITMLMVVSMTFVLVASALADLNECEIVSPEKSNFLQSELLKFIGVAKGHSQILKVENFKKLKITGISKPVKGPVSDSGWTGLNSDGNQTVKDYITFSPGKKGIGISARYIALPGGLGKSIVPMGEVIGTESVTERRADIEWDLEKLKPKPEMVKYEIKSIEEGTMLRMHNGEVYIFVDGKWCQKRSKK
jgi:hypothetical protein